MAAPSAATSPPTPTTLIACPDCAAIQRMPPPPKRGRLECWQCGHPLEKCSGRSLDGALGCAIATLLLLLPANLMPVMTVQVAGISRSTWLASGLATIWHQHWPLVAISLGLFGVILPFLRFGLLSVTLAAIRLGVRDRWVSVAFRYSEVLDVWAMLDALLIGAGIGYGRIASQIPVTIDPGGWCFVGAALMTMLTRATLERRAVWRRLEVPPCAPGLHPVACTSCCQVLPRTKVGRRCPRCGAPIHRRRPHAIIQCAALTVATVVLTPIAYGYPMSEFWAAGSVSPHSVINGIALLFGHGFWYFGIIIFLVSVAFPLTKQVGLIWFLTSIHVGSSSHLRFKTELYRFIDDVGRWSMLDPFAVMIFVPLGQFGEMAHISVMGGTPAFLATVVLSMVAARAFDPRLMWDAGKVRGQRRVAAPVRA
jgi:paraquat-inducible protein A